MLSAVADFHLPRVPECFPYMERYEPIFYALRAVPPPRAAVYGIVLDEHDGCFLGMTESECAFLSSILTIYAVWVSAF